MRDKKISNMYSTSNYVSVSPLKVSSMVDQISNRSCNEALLMLKFMPQKSCSLVSKVMSSAVSNAKNNWGWQDKSFFILEARVDEGPFLKRFCPHAQGSAFPIKKSMSHMVSLIL